MRIGVALLMYPGLASHENALPESLAAAKQLNLRVLVLKATTAEEIERAFTTAVNARVDAIKVYGVFADSSGCSCGEAPHERLV